jgi:hypothetical protein
MTKEEVNYLNGLYGLGEDFDYVRYSLTKKKNVIYKIGSEVAFDKVLDYKNKVVKLDLLFERKNLLEPSIISYCIT